MLRQSILSAALALGLCAPAWAADCSATLTGGAAKKIISVPANGRVPLFTIGNTDATTGGGEPVWISFSGDAVASAPSWPLAAPTSSTFAGLSTFTTPPNWKLNGGVSVIAATTGHHVSCTIWGYE